MNVPPESLGTPCLCAVEWIPVVAYLFQNLRVSFEFKTTLS
jgi:hypothetical protein